MHRKTLELCAVSLLVGTLSAQAKLTVQPYGNGSDGALKPTAKVTFDTDVKAHYQFTEINIPAGVTVKGKGSKPLYIQCTGKVIIDGKLSVNGGPGAQGNNNTAGGAGGAAGAGGHAGGTGGASTAKPFVHSGTVGFGPGGGKPGVDKGTPGSAFGDPCGGGGGGGNATAGTKGGVSNSGSTVVASGAGGIAGVCRGGSGGGGGGADLDSATVATSNDGGSGGGGGGGWVVISAPSITIGTSGLIVANGGAGGTNPGNGGAGGGGAGGAIDIVTSLLTHGGNMSAVGGAGGLATQSGAPACPGGKGGDGCINVYGVVLGKGTSTPAHKVHGFAGILNASNTSMDIAIQNTNANDSWMTGAGLLPLVPPWNSPWGPVHTVDWVFMLTLFQNDIPPGFKSLNGKGASGKATVLFPSTLKQPPMDVSWIIQTVTVNTGNLITGVSNRVDVILKF